MPNFFNFLHNVAPVPLLHVFYHVVTDEPAPHIEPLYPVRSVRQFSDDLDWLLRRFTPVTLEEVGKNIRTAKPAFHLSFDDGLRQCSDTIKPILLAKGVPATFFINSAFVNNQDLMFRYKAALLCKAQPKVLDYVLRIPYAMRAELDLLADEYRVDFPGFLRNYQPYMTHAQITDLAVHGFSIGAHSIDHPMFSEVDEQEQVRQAQESLALVQTNWPQATSSFAFPFTDMGVGNAFFKQLPQGTLSFGAAGLKREYLPYHHQRLPMERTSESASWIVGQAYLGYFIKMMLGRHIARR
jgi:peptidoglycan/xylan/chitin deacetylase (PgdA/CDA1 family)